jgi:hypothetical protein
MMITSVSLLQTNPKRERARVFKDASGCECGMLSIGLVYERGMVCR